MLQFSALNWIAVLVAALSGFVIGSLWYGPLFQKPWMRHSGMTFEKGAQGNMPLTFGGAYVLNVIVATGIGLALQGVSPDSSVGALCGALIGGMAGVLFMAPALGVIYLFEQRPLGLWLVNAGYQVVNFAAMGAILGAWPR